tara:strand:- start:29 stop:334 length:306 start_codon:yes stop_codon:yes gene_type:complete
MIENIKAKIKAYCEANGVSEDWFKIELSNNLDERGTFISKWEMSISEPTEEQLNSYSVSQTDQEYDEAKRQAKADLKASAKAKLIAGDPLTEEEANILVGV